MESTDFDPIRHLNDAKEPCNKSKLITPKIGYTIKTTDGSGRKVFINVCSSSEVEAPGGWANGSMSDAVAAAIDCLESEKANDASDLEVLRFSTCSDGPRDDVDHTGAACRTIDCVINSDLMAHAEHVRRLKSFVTMILLDHVSKKMGVTLNKAYKLPRLRYKATTTHPAPLPQHIRKDPQSLVTEVNPRPSEPDFPLRIDKQSTDKKSVLKRKATTAPRTSAGSSSRGSQQQTVAKLPGSGVSHTIRYEGVPADCAVIEVELPAATQLDDLTVTACGGDVQMRGNDFSIPVALPFGIDAASAVANVSTMNDADGNQSSVQLSLRLPYHRYSSLLKDEAHRAAVPVH